MTYFDMWIGDLDDPDFKWHDGNYDGNLPKRKSPMFPPARDDYFFRDFFRWVELRRNDYKQTDWDGWVAKVTKEDILNFIDHRYKTDPRYTDPQQVLYRNGKAVFVEQLNDLIEYVSSLDDEKLYALVAAEF